MKQDCLRFERWIWMHFQAIFPGKCHKLIHDVRYAIKYWSITKIERLPSFFSTLVDIVDNINVTDVILIGLS